MEMKDIQRATGTDPVQCIGIKTLGLPAIQPSNDRLCNVCPKAGHFRCSDCLEARYWDCQKIDRSTHKIFCKSFKFFSGSNRQSPLHIRCIFFPEDKGKPEWTWVKMSEDHSIIHVSRLYDGLPTDGLTREMTTIFFTSKTMRGPSHWLTGLLRNQTSRGENASHINKSLLGLAPPGHLETHWGPMLVVSNIPDQASSTGAANPYSLFQDVEMHDVWTTIGTLTYGLVKNPCVVNGPRVDFTSLPGLKINCVGDRARFHPDKDPNSDAAIFEAVSVRNYADPLKGQWPSFLAATMSLPWLCRVVHNSINLWPRDPNGNYSIPDGALIANPELGLLHCFLKLPDWVGRGAPDQRELARKEGEVLNIENGLFFGSVILVHMYGERIHPEHVKMANMFIKDRGYGDLGSRIMDLTGFDKYWDQKQRENNVPGLDLRGVPSPFGGQGFQTPEERCVDNLHFYNVLFEGVRHTMSVPRSFNFCDGVGCKHSEYGT